MATNHEIVQAYRALYRQGLLACRRAKPARYTLRDHLRAAFANSPRESYDPAAIEKTLTFLSNAAQYTGVEQKVVRNLLYVWRTRERSSGFIKATPPKHARNDAQYRQDAYSAFDRDLDMMNKTLGTCIK